MTLICYIVILAVILILVFFIKRYTNGPLNPLNKDLTGKLVIITGASDGLGLEIGKNLLKSNANVIFACRNKTKTENIINNLPEKSKKNATFEQIDLESFKSIETFVKEIKSKYPKIDILINNAGMVYGLHKTEDGFVNEYQINYLGPCLLTLLLLDHFNEKESKIINVSSMGYKFSKLTYGDSKYLGNYDLMLEDYYHTWNKQSLYGHTKLLLNYFTQYMGNLTEKKYPHLKVVCLHPGAILTKIIQFEKLIYKIIFIIFFKFLFYLFGKDVVHGAQTTLFLSYSENKDIVNGGYYNNLKLEKYTPKGRDEKLRNEMVNETLKILKSRYKELEFLSLSE